MEILPQGNEAVANDATVDPNAPSIPPKRTRQFITYFMLQARAAYNNEKNLHYSAKVQLRAMWDHIIEKGKEYLGENGRRSELKAMYRPYRIFTKAMLMYAAGETAEQEQKNDGRVTIDYGVSWGNV